MRTQLGVASIVGFLGFCAVAVAQTAPSTGATAFDGTYRLVSSTNLTKTYVSKGGRTLPCPARKPGSLSIAQGQVSYTSGSGRKLAGMVNPQGGVEIDLGAAGLSNPTVLHVSGTVDASGMLHARQEGNACSYDFVWQRS